MVPKKLICLSVHVSRFVLVGNNLFTLDDNMMSTPHAFSKLIFITIAFILPFITTPVSIFLPSN